MIRRHKTAYIYKYIYTHIYNTHPMISWSQTHTRSIFGMTSPAFSNTSSLYSCRLVVTRHLCLGERRWLLFGFGEQIREKSMLCYAKLGVGVHFTYVACPCAYITGSTSLQLLATSAQACAHCCNSVK